MKNILWSEWLREGERVAQRAAAMFPALHVAFERGAVRLAFEGWNNASAGVEPRMVGVSGSGRPEFRIGGASVPGGSLAEVIAYATMLDHLGHCGAWVVTQFASSVVWFADAPCDFCGATGEARGGPCARCDGTGKRNEPKVGG